MTEHDWPKLIGLMEGARRGLSFAEGLSDAEVRRAEDNYGFRFPPDLKSFLQTALPVGHSFPDWRSADDVSIKERLQRPLAGILFDVEQNHMWLPEWGERPRRMEDAKSVLEQLVEKAPRLIPIYSHRMMPDRPHLAGNPVLSVHQTDIIYYGFDLEDYLRHEFGLPARKAWPTEVRPIEFWDVDLWQEVRWREEG